MQATWHAPIAQAATVDLPRGQQAVLDFICEFKRNKGYPPTRAEIAIGLKFKSANAAEEHLQALARKGVIRLERGISRGIVVL
jgi:repressor LexA